MSKPDPARYRTTNWSAYNAALRKRGSLLIWLDKEMAWHAPHEGRPGRRPVFSNAAIQFCLSIKVLFKLPLRQTAGMVASLLRLAGLNWPVPDYSTLCRRQKTLKVQIPYRRAGGPLNLLVDSTGIRFLGDGEWQARKHGVQGRRQWRKVHLAMDTATSDIRAVEFTPSREGDSPIRRANNPPDCLPTLRIAGPAGPDPRRRGHRHRDGRWRLRYPPLPRRHHRTRWHRVRAFSRTGGVRAPTPDPQERSAVEGGLPGRPAAQRDLARHTSLRPGSTGLRGPTGATVPSHSGSGGKDTTPAAAPKPGCPRRFSRTCGAHLLDLKSFGERIAAVRHCCSDRWRSNGSPQTAKPPKSTSASFAGSLEHMAFACSFINRFNALGTTEIVRVASA